jgi:hypothetical protein
MIGLVDHTMRVIRSGEQLTVDDLKKMASDRFGDMVKVVVDVERGIMVVDAELHSDQEALLINEGSSQNDLWGINLYPGLEGEDFVEFDSMINLRPSLGNRSRGVEDKDLRARILQIIDKLVQK